MTPAETSLMDERVWPQMVVEGDCWIWTGKFFGSTGNRPYIYWGDGKCAYVYRLTYQQLRDDIPDGLTIDHLCRDPRCCNPWHLEPVPLAVNIRRAHLRPHGCKAGHPWLPETTGTRANGYRYCRTCSRRRALASIARRKQAS